MNCSARDVRTKTRTVPELRFEEQEMTSFSGLVLFQRLFDVLDLRAKLRECVRGMPCRGAYSGSCCLLLLMVHLLCGWRRLRDLDYWRDDPLLLRILGLRRAPDVSTLTRMLRRFDAVSVERYRELSRSLVVDRLLEEKVSTITIDLDGSVLDTRSRRTEGTAHGYNRNRRNARSYYPLFATVAQTGQVLDHLHRSGNVHDSNGALEFFCENARFLRQKGFRGRLEARVDAAFFGEEFLFGLDEERVEFTASVPFERFPELKEVVERQRHWKSIDETWSCFEYDWKPRSWKKSFRILVVRQRKQVPTKGPIQLELWTPIDHAFEYKVIVTNKSGRAAGILAYHNGRGSQEGLFAQLKSQCQMDYIPTRRRIGNQVFLLSAIMAHNLARELQMRTTTRAPRSTVKRACLWVFEQVGTLRRALIQRAGRLTRPNGRLVLTVARNSRTQMELETYMRALQSAA